METGAVDGFVVTGSSVVIDDVDSIVVVVEVSSVVIKDVDGGEDDAVVVDVGITETILTKF